MRLITPILLLTCLALMFLGNTLYESGEIDNIYNLTTNAMVWNFSYDEQVIENISDITQINLNKAGRFSNVIYKGVDFVGYSAMEIGKFFIEFGFNNHEYDYNKGINLIRLYLILMILAVSIPIIIPLLALITIIFISIKHILKKGKKGKKEEISEEKQ